MKTNVRTLTQITKQTHQAHLPSELVDALEDLVPGPEPEPREEAEVLVDVSLRRCLLEYNLRTRRATATDGVQGETARKRRVNVKHCWIVRLNIIRIQRRLSIVGVFNDRLAT